MRDDKHPNGFICECGRGIEFPALVHQHWDRAVEAACKNCGRIWKGRRGVMRSAGKVINLWTPRGLN